MKNYQPEPVFCRSDIDIEIAQVIVHDIALCIDLKTLVLFQNALRLQKLIFFGRNFLCTCHQPILKLITLSSGKVEYVSIVQNRTESTSDSEILLESFSDEEGEAKQDPSVEAKKTADKIKELPDLKTHHDAAEIRKLLRRKDELERKQRMEEKYNERLQVSRDFGICGALTVIRASILRIFYDHAYYQGILIEFLTINLLRFHVVTLGIAKHSVYTNQCR